MCLTRSLARTAACPQFSARRRVRCPGSPVARLRVQCSQRCPRWRRTRCPSGHARAAPHARTCQRAGDAPGLQDRTPPPARQRRLALRRISPRRHTLNSSGCRPCCTTGKATCCCTSCMRGTQRTRHRRHRRTPLRPQERPVHRDRHRIVARDERRQRRGELRARSRHRWCRRGRAMQR